MTYTRPSSVSTAYYIHRNASRKKESHLSYLKAWPEEQPHFQVLPEWHQDESYTNLWGSHSTKQVPSEKVTV